MARVGAIAVAAILSACSATRIERLPATGCRPAVRDDDILCGDDLVATVTCEGRKGASACRALAVVYASGQRVYLHKAPAFDEWPNSPRPGDKSDHILGYTRYAIAADGRGVRFLRRALLGSSWREYDVFTGRTRDAPAPEVEADRVPR